MKEILKKFVDKGFDAYIVGGYVRDFLLGYQSYDIDICTNASIDNIVKILGKGGKVYKEYFSYHFKEYMYNYDITTFRKELKYKDNKPTKIMGVNDLYTDLLRRDFTINTLCLDKDNNLIDLLGAKKDLDNKVIKVVGNTYDRLIEDKTRILRAIRFSSLLNFELDSEIKSFLKEKGYLLKELNDNYIKSELDLIFNGNSIRFFDIVNEYNLKEYLRIDYDKIIYDSSYYGMWAQIECNFNFSKEDKFAIKSIKKLLNKKNIDAIDIYRYGEFICSTAALVMGLDIKSKIDSLSIRNVFDIEIENKTVNKYIKKEDLNKFYKSLEEKIINKELNNNKYDIIQYMRRYYE